MPLDDAPDFEVRSSKTKQSTGYAGLFTRLVGLTDEPESSIGCWLWTGLVKNHYPRFNIRTPYDGHKQIRAHRAMLVLMEIGDETEHFWDLYYLYSLAEFEGDHLCERSTLCIAPDHLQLLTKDEHVAETKRRQQGIYRAKSSQSVEVRT